MILVEGSRMPVDDPNTHLELTMIHEVMILDNSQQMKWKITNLEERDGFVPAVCRQCPVILVQMPLIEEIRRLAGLGHI